MQSAKAGILLLLCFVLAGSAAAQQTCPLPPVIQPVAPEANIFSDQQEIDLGDATAEGLAQKIKIVDDDHLSAYLRVLGDRVVQHLPPTKMKFRFSLIELPEVNAFSIAGGRVYVSRKMVALAQSDDELAGVLAHELGHIVTHQSSILITKRLREVLGVTQVGERADIFNKFHQLLENEARKPVRGGLSEEKGQYAADQVALYAMARAGYAPHAYVDLWDRFQQTHGKTGSWLSNLLGDTKPAQRRLGEMVKNLSALPAGCADIPPGSRTAEFAKWQTEVINYTGGSANESLPGLVLKQPLAVPLRPDISNLRFSPDGKYILAQDESGIHVLTHEPFAVLFYIPAVNARDAKFTPDSQSVAFHNSSLRVESWSVTDQKQTSVHELTVLRPCIQSELSPDATVLACLDDELQLSLLDVISGATLASKKRFVELTLLGRLVLFSLAPAAPGTFHFLEMHFSPDSRYFLAGAGGTHFAWDLSNRREVPVPGSIRDVLKESFAFLGPDRVIGIETSSPAKSPILRFPSGERLAQARLANRIRLGAVTHGDYLLVGPLKNQPLGLLDLNTGALPLQFKRDAADLYDGTLITERVTGELALHSLGNLDTLAVVKLPKARLGLLQAAAVSPDFNWMAISNSTRGALWDITHGIQTMELRSFHGAWAGNDQIFYVDLQKFGDVERQIARLNPVSGSGAAGYKTGDVIATQYGPYFVVTTPKEKGLLRQFSNADLEVQDVHDGHVIWKRHFAHELPALSFGADAVLLGWPVFTAGGHSELQQFPELRNNGDNSDYFWELRDLKTDSTVGKIRINTNKGSFHVQHAFMAGDWLIVSASNNQVLTYLLASGKQNGHFFGSGPIASASSGLLATDSESGHLKLYDLASSQLRQEYVFPDPISFKVFSPDGKRLLVVTAGQTAYVLGTSLQSVSVSGSQSAR